MGFCVDKSETRHNLSFEICEKSVVFYDVHNLSPEGWVEIDMTLLRRMVALFTDPEWSERLGVGVVDQQTTEREDDESDSNS